MIEYFRLNIQYSIVNSGLSGLGVLILDMLWISPLINFIMIVRIISELYHVVTDSYSLKV